MAHRCIIDQFIASSESKCRGRAESFCYSRTAMRARARNTPAIVSSDFLQLCARKNAGLPTGPTPRSSSNVCGDKVRRDFRKPLILMTPSRCCASEQRFLARRFKPTQLPTILPPTFGLKRRNRALIFSMEKSYYDCWLIRKANSR